MSSFSLIHDGQPHVASGCKEMVVAGLRFALTPPLLKRRRQSWSPPAACGSIACKLFKHRVLTSDAQNQSDQLLQLPRQLTQFRLSFATITAGLRLTIMQVRWLLADSAVHVN